MTKIIDSSTNERDNPFSVGQQVALKAEPSRQGVIIEVLPAVRGSIRYRIYHSPTEIREYDAEQIMMWQFHQPISRLEEVLYAGPRLKPDEFIARLTARRLNLPQADVLYALRAGRLHFIPFQFKPLLRFLRADRFRMLIADEVGVGKTIEAGLILCELQSRQEINNVLVICPKALVVKWRAEMRRFDEDFRILTGETLRYCLKETQRDGVWPAEYGKSIAYLELLRREEYLKGAQGRYPRPGLLTLDPAPQFDLVIVDEAHHLRNPDSNTYELARFLCDVAEAVLFLTATPIQLRLSDLFTLLNLLQPDIFMDEALFETMIAPNRHLTHAIRHVRTKQPAGNWATEAHSALEAASGTQWGKMFLSRDPRLISWLERLSKDAHLSEAERIRLIRDIEEVHTLAGVMNRTRRRDIGRFTIREPRTVTVAFTPEQERLYTELLSLRREILALDYSPQVLRLLTITLERQAASCLPALTAVIDEILRPAGFNVGTITDDPEVENEDVLLLPPQLQERAIKLRRMAASLPDRDPKLEALLQIVGEAIKGKGPGKVLIFSFFLRTLAYLHRQLLGKGCRVALITGQVDDREREHLRERFRLKRNDPEALDVLLSSEVGCEGLDYEFCDCLVNYDIPWNPMRIEQRIGRIDRFGQKSEKVLIYNFVTPETIEERIFHRCYERLGVFCDSIGDLEEILGEVTEELNRAAFDPVLTPAQAEEKARQIADNAIRHVEELRRLEEQSGDLLALDLTYQEELAEMEASGRVVTPGQLQQMIELYLNACCEGGKLLPDRNEERVFRLQFPKAGRIKLIKAVKMLKQQDKHTREFIRWLESGERKLAVTFDQEVALEQRTLPFVIPIHPLARVAADYWAGQNTPLTAQLEVNDGNASPGLYVFVYYQWETFALVPELYLFPLVWISEKACPAEDIAGQLHQLLPRARQIAVPLNLDKKQFEQIFRALEEMEYDRRQEELKSLRARNQRLVEQRLATLDTYYQRRIGQIEGQLAAMHDQRIRRMKEAEKKRVERELLLRREAIAAKSNADIVSQRVAAGILLVRGETVGD